MRLGLLLALIFVALVGTTACGVDEVSTGLPAVRARGRLRAACSGKFPPFNFYDEANELTGFDVAIAKELARRIGLEPELKTLQWDGIIAGLEAGRYDAIVGSMAITPKRQEAVDFTDPYYRSGAQIFARPGGAIAADGTLEGAVMGVNLGTTYEEALRKLPGLDEVRTYSGIPEILVDLEAGRLDGFVTDRLVGLHAIQKGGVSAQMRGPLLYQETIAVAIQKGQPELRQALNQALAAMRADGTYARFGERWFGRDISTDADRPTGKPGPPDVAAPARPRARGIDFTAITPYLPALFKGLRMTLWITFFGSLIALLLGQAAALMRRSNLAPVRFLGVAYTDFFRGTPLLVQLFALYFGAPQLGLDISAVTAGILGLALNYGAYAAEILRASIDAVPRGQWEAARALGMGEVLLLRRVVLPQAYRIATPPLVGIVVALLKDSSLVSTITVVELTRQAQVAIGNSFRAVELYTTAAILYFCLTYPLMRLGARLEARMSKGGRH